MKKLSLLIAICGALSHAHAKPAAAPLEGQAVVAAPAPGGYVAPGGALPPSATMSNNQITTAHSDSRISATQMSIKGAEFDLLMSAAIDAGDVEHVRELLRSGVKVGFHTADKSCSGFNGSINLFYLPAACDKAFLGRAVTSPLLNPKARKPLLINAPGGRPSESIVAQAKASLAKDRDMRQIIADLVANTPAVDKAYLPAYALTAQNNGDYDLAWWFYQQWKAALPEISKAPEIALPARVEMAKKGVGYTDLTQSWPRRWGFTADSVGLWQDNAHPAALLLLSLMTRAGDDSSPPFTMAELRGTDDLTVYYAPKGSYFTKDQPARLRMVRRLLAEKPDFNFQDTMGNSPLHFLARGGRGADRRGSGPIIRALLEAGANPNLLNKSGETPMAIAVKNAAAPTLGANRLDDRSSTLKAFTDKTFEIDLPERTGKGMPSAQAVYFTRGLGF